MQICEIKCGVARTPRGSDLRAKFQSFESYGPGGRAQGKNGAAARGTVARAGRLDAIDATLAISFLPLVINIKSFT